MTELHLLKPGEVPDSIRQGKFRHGEKFASAIASRHLQFVGIAGSVSYVPGERDDVDMFIITRKNSLWTCMLMAYLTRFIGRSRDICLSLNMDVSYARYLFRTTRDPLIASDSVHVVPIIGDAVYRELLSSSPFISELYPDRTGTTGEFSGYSENGMAGTILDWVCFLILAPIVLLKGNMVNWYRRKHDRMKTFRLVIGRHCLFYDNLKYEIIRRNYYRK